MSTVHAGNIRHEVVVILDGEENFDVDNIVSDLVATYDLVGDRPSSTVADIPADAFWAIVRRHATGN
jgi:hypothetical protein